MWKAVKKGFLHIDEEPLGDLKALVSLSTADCLLHASFFSVVLGDPQQNNESWVWGVSVLSLPPLFSQGLSPSISLCHTLELCTFGHWSSQLRGTSRMDEGRKDSV